MQLTAETLAILKNYATINQNIQFKEGQTLSTISPQKNILTSAEISEDIPSTFAIYDLNKLLGALSLFEKSPELNVGENKLNIVDSKKIQISKEEAEEFYKVHQTKPFYEKTMFLSFFWTNNCNNFRW